MTKDEMTAQIIAAKKAKGITWEALANDLGKGTAWVTSACLGMNSMAEDSAKRVCAFLELDEAVCEALQDYPYKSWDKTVPQDPVIYRLYEVMGVYGDTIKELIHEQFGDGIMSAIDFSLDVTKESNPKGDRVVITLNGKFLPYSSW